MAACIGTGFKWTGWVSDCFLFSTLLQSSICYIDNWLLCLCFLFPTQFCQHPVSGHVFIIITGTSRSVRTPAEPFWVFVRFCSYRNPGGGRSGSAPGRRGAGGGGRPPWWWGRRPVWRGTWWRRRAPPPRWRWTPAGARIGSGSGGTSGHLQAAATLLFATINNCIWKLETEFEGVINWN